MRNRITFSLIMCLPLMMPIVALAQQDGTLVHQNGYVGIMPMYQRWSVGDTLTVSQASTAIDLLLPAGRNLQFTLRSIPYTSGHDGATISGFNDTQLGAAYTMEKERLVFSLGVNIPTGKQELTLDEFKTSLLVSNRILQFRSPQFGQGLKVQPAVFWAIPISKQAVAGVGAAYQYRASYKPVKGLGEYDPGDEIILTAGVDISTGEASALSFDAVYTHSGNDMFEGLELFRYGDRLSLNAQYRTAFGRNSLWLAARYRMKAKSDLWPAFDSYSASAPPETGPYAGYVVSVQELQEPNNAEIAGYYGWDISRQTLLGIEARVTQFSETDDPLSGALLAGAALAPEFRFGKLTVPVRAGIAAGSASRGGSLFGFEAGAGIRYRLD